MVPAPRRQIAEVRAYHHGDRANPTGDLLGFDFAGRGCTSDRRARTGYGWTAVVRDTGERATRPRSPMSTSSCARRLTAGCERRSRRMWTSGRRRGSSRASFTYPARPELARPEVPARAWGQARLRPRRSLAEWSAAAGASGVGALGAHTGIATPPCVQVRLPDQHERFCGRRSRAQDRGARDHRARGGVRRRRDPHRGARCPVAT